MMNDTYSVCFEQFYCIIARYLLDERLVDKLEFDEKRLVVHESCSGGDYEFILRVHRLDGGK